MGCAKICNMAVDCHAFNFKRLTPGGNKLTGECYFVKAGDIKEPVAAPGYTAATVKCLKSVPKDKSKLDECQKK